MDPNTSEATYPIHPSPNSDTLRLDPEDSNWMMGKISPERPTNLMVKTHGFPVKIFPTNPIQ